MYFCTCPAGYVGAGSDAQGTGNSCTNINECSGTHNCDTNSACSDDTGGYRCTCNKGYYGSYAYKTTSYTHTVANPVTSSDSSVDYTVTVTGATACQQINACSCSTGGANPTCGTSATSINGVSTSHSNGGGFQTTIGDTACGSGGTCSAASVSEMQESTQGWFKCAC